jgi:GGDEF domain-containing protein
MNANADFYQVLQVGFTAEKADITAAYRRLSKLYHPDISALPQSHKVMAQLNVAYDTLSDDAKRQDYNNSLRSREATYGERAAAEAHHLLADYFTRLLQGDFAQAFQLLCPNDRLRVGARAFMEWRRAVQELYVICEFRISQGQQVAGFMLEANRPVTALKFFVDVLEKDQASGRLEQYCFSKYVVFEQGRPGVYLGYRDLGEISKTLGSQAREREQLLMQENWQQHVLRYDRTSGLLTRAGLLWAAQPELYRAQRYKRPLTVALLRLRPARPQAKLSALCLEAAAQALQGSLRLTDIPAHLGNGLFAVLFFELKKRHATLIVKRALQKAGQGARAYSKEAISAACACELYSGGSLEGYLERLGDRVGLGNRD